MENSNNNVGKIVSSLLIGAAIGGILGILFAPEKGSKTRKKISGKTEDFTNSIKDKFNSFLEEAKSEFEEVKSKFEEVKEDTKDKAKDLASTAKG